MTFPEKLRNKRSYISLLKLSAVILLAFLAGLLFRRSAGLLAMFPIWMIFCGISAFIAVHRKIKLTIFGAMVFTLNTVESDDLRVTLTFVALCLLACLLFELSAKLIKQKKKSGYYAIAAAVVLPVLLSGIFIGNPISGIKSNKAFKNYVADKYLSSEYGSPEEFSFTEIYYNAKTRAFEFQATASEFPTEVGLISVKGDSISDKFQPIVQAHLSEPYIAEITAILREKFPDEAFTVSAEDLYPHNQKEVISANPKELYGSIVFEINLSGVQTEGDMERKVRQYTAVIDNAGIDYGRIIYTGGINPWVRKTATVTKQRPMGDHIFALSRVPVFTSSRFNRFAESDITIK